MPPRHFSRPQQSEPEGKWRSVLLTAVAVALSLSLWFAASAVIPQLTEEWKLSSRQQSWMTMSVQLGFVAGALISAVVNLSDRLPTRRLFALSSLAAAVVTASIPFVHGPSLAIACRFLTGCCLVGVYPPGMKLMASWTKKDRGLGMGILVGALTLGSATPHLLNVLSVGGVSGMPSWRIVLWLTASQAVLAAIISLLLIQEGPYAAGIAPFDWRFARSALADRPIRLANFGYLGHMWELYAMWTWVPIYLLVSFERAGLELRMARLAGFAAIAIGAIGCVVAGSLADRWGRTRVTVWSLAVSGACALMAGSLFDRPAWLTALCLIWGFAVIADSGQFSAAVSELTDRRYIGTALTLQTSLGFLLTLVTIRLVPVLVERIGWQWVFVCLVPGPLFGIWSMRRLRTLPESANMASGNR